MRKFNIYFEKDFTLSLPVNLCIKEATKAHDLTDYPNTEFIGNIEALSYEEAMRKVKEKLKISLADDK